VFTSNVDGAFEEAGFLPDNICEIHGSIRFLQPVDSDNEERKVTPASETELPQLLVDAQFNVHGDLPTVPSFDKRVLARPNIYMFSDHEFIPDRTDAQYARYGSWLKAIPDDAHVVILEVGAGRGIPTIRRESEQVLKRFANGTLLRVNVGEPDLDKPLSRGQFVSIAERGKKALELIFKIWSV
jgi:NAD-dependent SIR2 family protein deacetylase